MKAYSLTIGEVDLIIRTMNALEISTTEGDGRFDLVIQGPQKRAQFRAS